VTLSAQYEQGTVWTNKTRCGGGLCTLCLFQIACGMFLPRTGKIGWYQL